MTSWQITRIIAGMLILVSLAIGAPSSPLYVSSWWLWLTVFVGANLMQSGFTQWCPMEIFMRKLGLKGGA
ncbi:DUF2892 domain-containing protein [Burkholderia thailandensis]|uniref:Inner membrane protein YgaP-like transmembrane domain-containing protein n=2 Tax=Burkholderia thailandensis TaxID=57975 RepID=A0AAW9CPI0_BURTH|nr:DUF2892 domain-containing protein [Burkholderia thailandensis]ABC35582.1 conserved hypothetical protein [Burkholderia thailandensis E264]AHI68261.1 hypothetical protein BTL_5179 [Burkholderia thailandensis H0587]AHI75156.1 hypothetical protein BTQ_3347 [Burkholderia thailandensis 2002721723]AHI81838.1 hypothetical protein BTJ_4379 [Burkholderia thailandensis E444]AIC90227.1 hypothetical protein BTRA_5109 [Burkholderia thailandensis USAMRU Malaysia \